jgi:spoIIIJ-associated protein
MESVEVEGKTVEDAIAAACKQLSQPRERLEIEDITPGSTGIFGIVGTRKARIRVRVKEGVKEAAPVRERGREARSREARPKEARPKEARPKEARPEEARPEEAREERRPSRRRRRGGRAGAAPPTEAAPGAGVAEPEVEPEEAAFEAEPARPEAPPAEPPAVASEELAASAQEVCRRIVEGLGYEEVGVRSACLPGEVRLELVGEEAQGLIGHRGDVLHALQHLVSKITNRGSGTRVPITIDIEGWRARRSQALEELAVKLARKAKESGKPVVMSPMNAHDRRVVHLALQQDGELTTKSRGEGALRKVVIFPRRAKRGPKGNKNSSRNRSGQDPSAGE